VETRNLVKVGFLEMEVLSKSSITMIDDTTLDTSRYKHFAVKASSNILFPTLQICLDLKMIETRRLPFISYVFTLKMHLDQTD